MPKPGDEGLKDGVRPVEPARLDHESNTGGVHQQVGTSEEVEQQRTLRHGVIELLGPTLDFRVDGLTVSAVSAPKRLGQLPREVLAVQPADEAVPYRVRAATSEELGFG